MPTNISLQGLQESIITLSNLMVTQTNAFSILQKQVNSDIIVKITIAVLGAVLSGIITFLINLFMNRIKCILEGVYVHKHRDRDRNPSVDSKLKTPDIITEELELILINLSKKSIYFKELAIDVPNRTIKEYRNPIIFDKFIKLSRQSRRIEPQNSLNIIIKLRNEFCKHLENLYAIDNNLKNIKFIATLQSKKKVKSESYNIQALIDKCKKNIEEERG